MYSQPFMPNNMYGQAGGVMPYAAGGVLPPSSATGSMPAPPHGMPPSAAYDYRGGNYFPQAPMPMPNGGNPSMMGPGQRPLSQPRPRNNEIGEVSRVIHLRNVTPEVTQLSVQNLTQNFGNIKHIVMLRQMNQALVEMESAESARQLVDFFREPGYAEVDGRRVYVRYSNHMTLTATQNVSRTLLVSMFNTHYDVSTAAQITPEVVYQIFANYGTVQKIVLLPKNESSQWNHNRIQALVQFESREVSEHVKNILQGQPVTLGDTVTFTLDIQFSRMDEIRTTNPMTSLVLDESGIMRRPTVSQTQEGSSSSAAGAPSQSSTGPAAQSPQQSSSSQQPIQSGIAGNNGMYAIPQQWN